MGLAFGHGVPTMKAMTAYDDSEVNSLINRIDLISDQSVPALCCTVEIDMEDGGCVVQEQNMTFADYSFDRREVSALIRRVGDESRVPAIAYDRLEDFAERLPDANIGQVLEAFSELQHLRAA